MSGMDMSMDTSLRCSITHKSSHTVAHHELEGMLMEAKERAQELSDQAAFDDAVGTAEAETKAWEQVRRLSKRTTAAQGTERETKKRRVEARRKEKECKDKIASRDATILATGRKAEKRKPDRIFLLTSPEWRSQRQRAGCPRGPP